MSDLAEHEDVRAALADARLAPILRALAASLSDVLGTGPAEETLFRLGRRLGALEAHAYAEERNPAAALRAAVSAMRRMGLAELDLSDVRLDPTAGPAQILGLVRDLGRSAADPSLCALTMGFLAGVVGSTAGLDLVSSELHCLEVCPEHGCGVDLHAAHRRPPRGAAGAAHFYLDSMGGALGEAEISLSELVESTHDAIILIDGDSVIRFWNRGAERMFQYQREEVVGQRVGFLVPPDLMRSDELGQLQAALDRDGFVLKHETRRVRRDGAELNVSLTRTVLLDDQRRPIGSTAIIRDVTELRAHEQELSATRTLAMIGRLAATVAHEIKNPLAGISGAIQVLRRGLPPADPRVEVFDDILLEVGRLDDTVGDLLRYSRPTPARPSATDLRTYVTDLVESFGFQHELADHRLELDLPRELIVPLDGRLIGPVLSNLLHNATQAMTRPGTIRIRAHDLGGEVRLDVEDEGPGVPPPEATRVFEPFFTTKSRGTGLGLAIARKNVELHGGRLELDPSYEGGARFSITLPLALADPAQARDA
jgi:PAS domain S-box-containing protein